MSIQAGRLELICGPMFAGKTTTLLERLEEARIINRTVVALKPVGDTRYAAEGLVSHDGTRCVATRIQGAADLEQAGLAADVVGLDEVHFFDADVAPTCRRLADAGKRVIVAGVDLDHRGDSFDVIAALEPLADEVTRLTSTCAQCGGVATHTAHLILSNARIAVGGPGDYEPRCPSCFEGGSAES